MLDKVNRHIACLWKMNPGNPWKTEPPLEANKSLGLRLRWQELPDGMVGIWLFYRDVGETVTTVVMPIDRAGRRIKHEGAPYGVPTFTITKEQWVDSISRLVPSAPPIDPKAGAWMPAKQPEQWWDSGVVIAVVWIAAAAIALAWGGLR